MNSELKDLLKEIQEYRMELETELKGSSDVVGLEKQLVELKTKLDEKGTLSRKDRKAYKKISDRIRNIKEYLSKCEELIKYENAKVNLKDILTTLPKLEKKAKIDEIVNLLKTEVKEAEKELADQLGFDEENVDFNKKKKDLEDKIADLESDMKILTKRNLPTHEIEFEIKEAKDVLEIINEHLKTHVSEEQMQKDLQALSNSKTKKAEKEALLEKYTDLIEELEAKIALELKEFAEVDKTKKEKKNKLKETSTKLSAWLKEHKKTLTKVGCVAIAGITLATVIKSCDLEEVTENKKPTDPTKPSNGTNIGAENYELAKKLESMGIDPIRASEYSHINEFNLSYLGDYQNAINAGIIETQKAVNYVNRAYSIQATRFFDDATILDIVWIIDAINNPNNKTIELNSIIGTLTSIYNNYQYQTLTQEDLNKLNALLYFANPFTDLDLFLTEYTNITQQVLNTKGDSATAEKAKKDMYNYLNIFANTFAGHVVEGEFTEINENAIVENTDDWSIAYASFVRPTMSMFITPENAEAYACLQINMLSNYEQWAKVNGCDHTLVLGK